MNEKNQKIALGLTVVMFLAIIGMGIQIHLMQRKIDSICSTADAGMNDLCTKIENIAVRKLETNTELINNEVSDVIKLCKNRVTANETVAKEAFERAVAEAGRNPDGARLLCLNAINHAPDNYKYVEGYIDIVMKMGDKLKTEDLNQSRSILEVAMYQVPHTDMAKVSALMDKISQCQDSISGADKAKSLATAIADTMQEFETLKSMPIIIKNGRVKDIASLKNKIDKLQELRSLLPTTGKTEDADFLKCINLELEVSVTTLDLAIKTEQLDNCLQNAKINLASQDTFQGVVASLQNASNILAQIWSLKLNDVPQPMIDTVQALGRDTESLEKDFLIKKSIPAEGRINALIVEAQKLIDANGGSFTSRIENCQNIFKKINNEFAGIYDQKIRLNLQVNIEKLSTGIARLNKERYQAYQAWATEMCQNSFKRYQSFIRVNETDAVGIFDGFDLRLVKQDLLVPEVNSIYNDILQKLYAKMTWQKRAEYEKKCATDNKKTLEDF